MSSNTIASCLDFWTWGLRNGQESPITAASVNLRAKTRPGHLRASMNTEVGGQPGDRMYLETEDTSILFFFILSTSYHFSDLFNSTSVYQKHTKPQNYEFLKNWPPLWTWNNCELPLINACDGQNSQVCHCWSVRYHFYRFWWKWWKIGATVLTKVF